MWIKTEPNILWEDRRHNPINLQGFKYDWLEENESNNEDSNEGDGEACDGVSGEHPVMDVVMQPDCLGKDKNGETIDTGLKATTRTSDAALVSPRSYSIYPLHICSCSGFFQIILQLMLEIIDLKITNLRS